MGPSPSNRDKLPAGTTSRVGVSPVKKGAKKPETGLLPRLLSKLKMPQIPRPEIPRWVALAAIVGVVGIIAGGIEENVRLSGARDEANEALERTQQELEKAKDAGTVAAKARDNYQTLLFSGMSIHDGDSTKVSPSPEYAAILCPDMAEVQQIWPGIQASDVRQTLSAVRGGHYEILSCGDGETWQTTLPSLPPTEPGK